MKSIFTILALCLSLAEITAQQTVHLRINHKLGDEPLVLGQTSENNLGHSFTISRIDYYISSISIQHDGGMQTDFPDVYILSKGTDEVEVMLGNADVNEIESITFSIGVESPVNNEDPAQWPLDHPLNYQSPSMHWGWSSGYRFAALEGQAGSTLAQNYQLHGLWNDNYFSQTIDVTGTQEGNMVYIHLDADYREALRDINVSTGPINHGTNTNDLTMLNNFKNYVFSPTSTTIGVSEHVAKVSLIYPNPTTATFRVSGITEQALVEVKDMMGRIVISSIVQPNGEIDAPTPGTYLVTIQTSPGETQAHKLIVQP